MSSLAVLFNEQNELIEKLLSCDGELSAEMELKLSELDLSIPSKVDSYRYIMDRLEAEEEYFSAKANEYHAATKVLANARLRIKDQLKHQMQEQGLEVLCGNDYQFKLSKTKGSVLVNNEDLIPKEYIKEVLTRTVDKVSLAQDLKEGMVIPGVSLSESVSLRSSVMKNTKSPVKKEKTDVQKG